MEVSGQFYAPVSLPIGKISQDPMNWRLGTPLSQPGRFVWEINILPLIDIENIFLGRPACNLVGIFTYPDFFEKPTQW
jgi:hypothetical protein